MNQFCPSYQESKGDLQCRKIKRLNSSVIAYCREKNDKNVVQNGYLGVVRYVEKKE